VELSSSSARHADSPDDGSTNVDDSHLTSISAVTPVEQRRDDRTKESSSPLPHLSTSHASHCANPVCLRERLPQSDMCSHRLALSTHGSSPDHARVRVAVLQRPRCSSNVYDVDGGSSLPRHLLSSGGRTANRRNLSPRSADIISCYSTLPPCTVIDVGDRSPRLRGRHGQRAAVDAGPYGSTTPRQQRISTASDRRRRRESASPSSTRKLSGSSSALDIRDLEIAATTSPYSTTLRAKSPAAQSSTVATSLHDILSPPFGPPMANGPKPSTGKALRLKPGEQDEFGTAV